MKQHPLIHYPSIAAVFTINIDDMDVSDRGAAELPDQQIELIHIDAIAEAYRAAQNKSSAAERLEWRGTIQH